LLPERSRLERDIRAGKIDTILCIELSRLSRDDSGRDFLEWVQLCADHNVKLATLSQVLDPNEISHNILLRLTDTMSASEMLWLKKRMREGREEAIRAGKYINGNPPPPYYHDPVEGGLKIDQEKRKEVETVLSLAETTSARKIAKSTGLAEITIRRMISDDRLLMYQGKRLDPQTGETIDGQWPAIIDAEQAERIRAGRRTRKSNGSARHHAGLLSNLDGLLQCGYCGRTAKTWRNSRIKNDGTRNNYYGCSANCQKSRLVQQQIIDDKVVGNLLRTLDNLEEHAAAWLDYTTKNDPTAQLLQDLDREEKDLKAKKNRLIEAITEGVIEFADAKETRLQIENALSAIEIKRKRVRSEQPAEINLEGLQIGREKWPEMNENERREIIQEAISSIKIYNSYALINYPLIPNQPARIHLPEPYKTPRRGPKDTSRK